MGAKEWGDLSESYSFDRAGRLSEIRYGDGSAMIYAFKDVYSSLPLKVTTPRGSDYILQYDEAGALQSLTTPRGHNHAFSLQTTWDYAATTRSTTYQPEQRSSLPRAL
jgi:YD repeat-containing protein